MDLFYDGRLDQQPFKYDHRRRLVSGTVNLGKVMHIEGYFVLICYLEYVNAFFNEDSLGFIQY